ncbi:DUF4340 domain-containing protein [Luteolibacter sp. Populi]|uniref:DUF4340 domain-containing protein n=1 Tax=Luteolibacter sp. Populi TaxID=3230487 RepID=UPI003465FC1E
MRSVTFTLLLFVLAASVTVVAALRIKEGNLSRLFGAPPVEPGRYLYKFDGEKVRHIQLGGNGFIVDCTWDKGLWTAEGRRVNREGGGATTTVLWKDRLDPRVADTIGQFTLGTQVVDVIPEGKLDTSKGGLKEGKIGVKIEDGKGELLATYLLGHSTKWVHIDPQTKQDYPTVFVQPLDPGRSDDTYVCTGDIRAVFRDGFRHLRDHHPFLFNPLQLEAVRIQDGEKELLLSRTGATTPWRITKPLELKTNPEAVKKLLTDLLNLRAVEVKDRSEVTLPEASTNGRQRFGLRHFGQKTEVVLEVMPPVTPEAETVFATVSDRPGTVFELRLKPLPAVTLPSVPSTPGMPPPPVVKDDMVALAELPDTIDELRDSRLSLLVAESLQGILISSSTGPEIVLSRAQVGADWLYRNAKGGEEEKANPITLVRLHDAITKSKVLKFVNDAATDLTPYGLDRPSISLRFVSFGSESFELVFGQSKDGTWYAMRAGVPIVMKIDQQVIDNISTQLWQWRQPYIWSLSDVNVLGVERQMTGKPDLLLEYDVVKQLWRAREGSTDRSPELVLARADKLLQGVIGLQVEEWLAPDHADAAVALASPTLRFEVTAKQFNEQMVEIGVAQHLLTLAPGPAGPGTKFYYGRVDKDPNPFRIVAQSAERLEVDVFADD